MQRRKSSDAAAYRPPPADSGPPLTAEWEPLAPVGPSVAYHTACIIRGAMYVHGGVETKDGKQPSNGLHKLDLSTGMWSKIQTSGSPALSHHCAVAIDDRYMLLVGGWNGRLRVPDVFAYDVQENQWLPMATVGFPEGAGLSSHTASLLSNGEILVIGREGSLRTQRRHGSAFLLSGNVLSGKYKYSEYSHSVSSRSGHSATFLGSKLYIIGGRSDNLLEVAGGFSPHPSRTCGVMATIAEASKVGRLKSLPKMPCGRKAHTTTSGPGVLLVYGGETFDGRSREPVGEMILIAFTPGPHFYTLGVSKLGRAGHVVCVTDNDIIMHGGQGGKSQVYGDAYRLALQSKPA